MTKSDLLGIIQFILVASFIVSGAVGFLWWVIMTLIKGAS